jgi:iron complex transport system substrate-binding protein
MKQRLFLVLFILSFRVSALECRFNKTIKTFSPLVSKGFSIDYYEGYKILHRGKESILLKNKNTKLHCETNFFIIEIPVEKVVLTSSTHLPALELLKLEEKLIGFQGKKYIYSSHFPIEKITNISIPLVPEELLKIKPDLIVTYELNNSFQENVEKLRKLNIPIVINDDYKETNAIARAEWLIYIASFFNREEDAQKIFKSIFEKYELIKNSLAKKGSRKKVLVGSIQNGSWVTCGGKSDLATLISDAGGDLLLSSDSHLTQTRSLEDLYAQPLHADVWLTQNSWQDLSATKRDSRYKKIKAESIYNMIARVNNAGANDYWEMGMARPDIMLEDVASMLHPEYFSKHQLFWYKKL